MTFLLEASLLMLALAGTATSQSSVMLSGEVYALDAESIVVPPSNSSPVALRYLVPEGSQVAAGDVLVRVDPGDALGRIESLNNQIAQAQARAERDVAELGVRELDAEMALVDADAGLKIALIDAAIPASFLSALDYDRYQAEKERADREHMLKTKELRAARDALISMRADKRIEMLGLQADLRFAQAQIRNAEQRATQSGVVLYGFNPLSGQRYQEGASAYMGSVIGMVVGDGELAVRAWALEPDRSTLAVGQHVEVYFDAIPASKVGGRIEAISGAPAAKAEWGDGRYFEAVVRLRPEHGSSLLPGMSARIEIAPAEAE